MGWLFNPNITRKELIENRTEDWERTKPDGLLIKTTCLAHCYRGGSFSGVLWAVWERSFTKDNVEVQSIQRWITCDLIRYLKDSGWGFKDMDESMLPYYYSCPLKYLNMVPIDQFGGHQEWRNEVHSYHQRQKEKRKAKTPA